MSDVYKELEKLKIEMTDMKEEMKKMQISISKLEGNSKKTVQTQTLSNTKKDSIVNRYRTKALKKKKETHEKSFELRLGQLMNRLGIVAVILGLSIFLKYSFDNQWIGPTGRIILGIIFGVSLWGSGEYIKKKYIKYSHGLTGGGSLAIFFSIYAGYSFYDLYSQIAAFCALVIVMVITVVQSVRHKSLAIGILGIIGGYTTPVLVSSGETSVLLLFSYLTLITIGALGVATHCKWMFFNYLSFVANQLYLFVWFMMTGAYKKNLGSTMLFLTIVFALYLGVSSLYNIKNKKLSNLGDTVLVALNAYLFFIWGQFSLQETFFKDYLGFYAIALAFMYILIGRAAYKTFPKDKKQLYMLFATAVVFITIAMPLQLDGDYLTFAWLTESLCLIGISFKLDNIKLRFSGIAIFALSLLTLEEVLKIGIRSEIFLLNRQTLLMTFVLIITAAIIYLYRRFANRKSSDDRYSLNVFKALFLIEIFLFLSIQNSHFFFKKDYDLWVSPQQLSLSGLWMLYAISLFVVGLKKRNKYFRYSSLALIAVIVLKAFFIDLVELQNIYKIVLFCFLGFFLLGVSFVYQKKRDLILESNKDEGV